MEKNELGEEIVFAEHTAAARSLKSSWTRIASTYDSIHVVLSREHLIVKPRRLLAGVISVLKLDLDHVIPTHRITTVEPERVYLSYTLIRIGFETDDGPHEGLDLYLRNPNEFLEQIDTILRR
jgi:hypothetical protein